MGIRSYCLRMTIDCLVRVVAFSRKKVIYVTAKALVIRTSTDDKTLLHKKTFHPVPSPQSPVPCYT